jgi:hypothetical protein
MLRAWVRRAGHWIGDSVRRESAPAPTGEATSHESLRQLLLFGDAAASAADGPSLPFLDTAPLTHHVEDRAVDA